MLKIVRERTPEIITEYYLEFKYKDNPEAGFCFPATRYGEPDFDNMSDEAKANYQACLTDQRLTEEEFTRHKWTYMNPALGICSCGKEVVLDCGYADAVKCECGKWYNLFGQQLLDPDYWEED